MSFILTVIKLVGPLLSPYVCFSCAPVVFLDYFSFAVLTVFFSVRQTPRLEPEQPLPYPCCAFCHSSLVTRCFLLRSSQLTQSRQRFQLTLLRVLKQGKGLLSPCQFCISRIGYVFGIFCIIQMHQYTNVLLLQLQSIIY